MVKFLPHNHQEAPHQPPEVLHCSVGNLTGELIYVPQCPCGHFEADCDQETANDTTSVEIPTLSAKQKASWSEACKSLSLALTGIQKLIYAPWHEVFKIAKNGIVFSCEVTKSLTTERA